MLHACNLSFGEVEAEGSGVQDKLGYRVRPSFSKSLNLCQGHFLSGLPSNSTELRSDIQRLSILYLLSCLNGSDKLHSFVQSKVKT